MFKPLAILGALALCLALAAPADAQSLDGEVVRNPDDTVTYDFHFNGPPRGKARLYLGLFLLDPPYHSSIGPLWLDPSWWWPVGSWQQLPGDGQGQLQFTIPSALTAGLPLSFQSINIDPAGTLRLSQNALSLVQNRPASDCNITYAFGYGTQSQTMTISGQGPPGATITIRVEDALGARYEEKVTVDEDGDWKHEGQVDRGLGRGDRVEFDCDGVHVDTFRLHQ